jgi:prepilin-type processing-associated H-X9-DG protein
MLVVVVVLVVLLLLALPLLNTQRERRSRAICAHNLSLIGVAVRAYQSDHHGLIPNAGLWQEPHQNDPSWDEKLIKGGHATPGIFHCPSDRIRRVTALCEWHPMSPAAGLRSYAINLGSNAAPETLWIQGSRLPCPHLPNPGAVVLCAEMVDDVFKGRIGSKCSGLAFNGPGQITSFHVKKPSPLARDPRTNYLFLDGHVAWVDVPRPEMFPPPPPGASFFNRPCP